MSGAHPRRLLAIALIAAAGWMLLAAGTMNAAHAACKGAHAKPSSLKKWQAQRAILCLVNKKRAKHGLSRLKHKRKPRKAAKRHSRRMVNKRCFSHRCGGEPDLTGRLERAGYLPCNCSWGIAENIAWGERGKGSPRRIVKAWMNSSAHRATILTSRYDDLGIGISWGSPRSGRKRNAATYTTVFGYKK